MHHNRVRRKNLDWSCGLILPLSILWAYPSPV
nr:MAG TPA: hypothetical protein [Caudoviricetes sp.]